MANCNLNLKEITVSVYDGVTDRSGRLDSLHNFLFRPRIDLIMALRTAPDPDQQKRLKRLLPQATVSGIFAPVRRADALVRHSGLLCVDIDAKDNPNLRLHPRSFADMEEVAVAMRSVSGRGVFLIVPVSEPASHRLHFRAFQRVMQRRGVVIDRCCSDVCRLRCQSYDPEAWVNPSPRVFTELDMEVAAAQPRHPAFVAAPGSELESVDREIDRLTRAGIDITAPYGDWVRLCGALSKLGEAGRERFKRLSSLHPRYNPRECDRMFDAALRRNPPIGLGTFYYLSRK